jgi:hypothetical protein
MGTRFGIVLSIMLQFLRMKKLITYTLVVIAVMIWSCSKDGTAESAASAGGTGTGGSLARFTIAGNYLYLADDRQLKVFDISTPAIITLKKTIDVGFGVETIYPYGDKLFIGSQLGMFIYSIANPENPVKLGEAQHRRSCDPVVAKDTMAYVTLKGGNICGPATDGLYSYSIKNISSPVLLNTLVLPKPSGLGYSDTTLFVCCEDSGLAVINIKNPAQPKLKKMITANSFYDVIPLNGLLVCMVKTGMDLYDITDVNNLVLIKHIDN